MKNHSENIQSENIQPEGEASQKKISSPKYRRWINRIVNWASEDNYQPVLVGSNCCGIHLHQLCSAANESKIMMSSLDNPIGMADLLLINGAINRKLLPKVLEAYEQLSGNKYVMTLGSCTSKMCFSDNSNVIVNISDFIPVDVHVPGCPPTATDFYRGLKELKTKR